MFFVDGNQDTAELIAKACAAFSQRRAFNAILDLPSWIKEAARLKPRTKESVMSLAADAAAQAQHEQDGGIVSRTLLFTLHADLPCSTDGRADHQTQAYD